MKRLNAYELEQKAKLRELQKRLMIAAIREDSAVEKQLQRNVSSRKAPYKPNSYFPVISPPPKRVTSPNPNSRIGKSIDKRSSQVLLDAETGEPLKYTADQWSGTEGRVKLDASSIALMSTGRLDVNEKERQRALANSKEKAVVAHELVRKLESEGPANKMFHKNWDPKTNAVSCVSQPFVSETSDSHEVVALAEDFVSAVRGTVNRLVLDRESVNTDTATSLTASTSSSPNGFARKRRESVTEGGDDTSLEASRFDKSSLGNDGLLSPVMSSPTPTHDKISQRRSIDYGNQHASGGTPTGPRPVHNGGPSSHHSGSRLHHSQFNYPAIHIQSEEIEWSASSNKWACLEEKYFQELLAIASESERNKFLTGEPSTSGGLAEITRMCRELARFKARGFHEVAQAIEDEENREKVRMKEVEECIESGGTARLAKLREDHAKERAAKRTYLLTLRHDNEVIFINKMGQCDWLW